ncbi:MAG: CoA pyrophosphatase [Chloroflexota bacterium]
MDKQTIRQILTSHEKKRVPSGKFAPAAVIVPVFCDAEECYIVFAKRSQNVTFHKGQFCFPGGRPHEGETRLLTTALRESHEEVGIKPEDIEILGELDDQVTTSGYIVTPFVGYIRHPYELMSDGCEVEEIINVPLRYLLNPKNWRQKATPDGQSQVPEYAIDYHGRIIWGATARILRQFLHLLGEWAGASQHT